MGCSPFQFGESFQIAEINFGPERRIKAEGESQQTSQDGDVHGCQGVAAGRESIGSVAVFEKYGGLAVADDQLSTEFKVGGSFLRDAMNHFFPGRINPFDYFNKQGHVTFLIFSIYDIYIINRQMSEMT